MCTHRESVASEAPWSLSPKATSSQLPPPAEKQLQMEFVAVTPESSWELRSTAPRVGNSACGAHAACRTQLSCALLYTPEAVLPVCLEQASPTSSGSILLLSVRNWSGFVTGQLRRSPRRCLSYQRLHSLMQKDAQANTAPKVRLVFQDAYQRFKDSISPEDAQLFQTLSLKDVENAMRDLERRQSASRTLRNLGRIMPFLDGLERYSKVVDTLCNGTPYLPYLWVSPYFLVIS